MSRSERRPLLIRSLLPDWVSELGYPTSATQMQRRLDAILDDDDYHTLIATGAFSVSSELASVRSMKMAPEEFLLRGAAVVGLGPGNDERGTQLRQSVSE